VREEFLECLLSAIPKPPGSVGFEAFDGRDVLIVDVSGSMDDHLKTSLVSDYLTNLVAGAALQQILAVNTEVVRTWDSAGFDAQDLSRYGGGGTDLNAALNAASVAAASAVVVTDSEGAEQLETSDAMVLNVADMSGWPSLPRG